MKYNVEYMGMGQAAGGFVVDRGGNLYTIVLNSDLPPAEQQLSLEHELAHIRKNHFADPRRVAAIEAETAKGQGVCKSLAPEPAETVG